MAEKIERTLQLKCAKRTFVDEDKKKEVEYDVFYVTIGGLDIRLRPSDSTARDLLLNFFNQE